MEKESYVEEYLALMDDLARKHHSRCWFATFTAARNREASEFFKDLYGYISGPGRFERSYRNGFPYARFFAISAMRTLRIWTRALIVKILFSAVVRKASKKKGLSVIRSWLFLRSVGPDRAYRDQFFGILPEYLEARGENVVIVGSVYSDRYFRIIKRLISAKGSVVIPQEYFVSFLDPVRIIIDILKRRTRINEKVAFRGRDITEILKFHLDRDFTDMAFENIMSFYMTKNLMKRLDVKTYILTYENNPWEKMTLDAIKTCSPSTKTIGYQHTIVSLGKLGMRLGEYEKLHMPMPDRIVTNGKATKDIVIKYGNYPADRIATGCALRFKTGILKDKDALRRKGGKTILLAPTALCQSVGILNVAYEAFKDMPEYRIVIRPHPGFPFKKIKRHLAVPSESFPSHFIVSSKLTLEDDLADSDLLIYDESSLCLNALLMGIPMIHINTDGLVSIDPLFDCRYLKREAADARGVLAAIDYFSGLEGDELKKQKVMAREYALSYLSDVTDENLKAFL